MDLINVVCLGDNDAKKTELMCVLTESQCACDEYACVHNKAKDIFTCKLRIKDFPIAYEIRIFNTVDSSSKGLDLDCLRRINYSKAEVMLLVFDLDNPDTLRSIKNKWLNECFEYAKSAKILLVGVESDTTGTHTDIHSIKSDIYTKFHLSYQKVCLESIEDIQGCWLSIIELYDGINRTKKKRRSFVDGFSEIKKKGTRILQKLLPEKQEDQDTEKSKGIHKNHEQESTTWQSELHTIFNKHDSQIFRHFIVDKVLSLRTRDLKALVLALGFDQKALKLPSHLSKSIKKPFWPMLKFWTEQTDDLQITRLPLMYSSLMNIKQKGIANDLLTSVKANYTDDSIRTSSMYCPVDSFIKYTDKLHHDCDRLWQRPRDCFVDDDNEIWYYNAPVGEKKLKTFMSDLSLSCKLSQKYTNHSIRATGASILSKNKFNDAQIMSVTGHKSVQSLSVYQRVDTQEKLEMGQTLGVTMGAVPARIEALPAPPIRSALPAPPIRSALLAPPARLALTENGSMAPALIEADTPQTLHSDFEGFDLNAILGDFDYNESSINVSNTRQAAGPQLFHKCKVTIIQNLTLNK